jgi:putative ABC transport system permease protein
MLITTAPGAAQQVGREAPVAIDPARPGSYSALVPPNPKTLRKNVVSTTSTLVLLVAGLAFLVGIVAIANTTLLAVIERVPEIGLRRALGARPRHVATTTLLEAAAIGTVGAILGDAGGILVTTGVSFFKTWTAVLEPLVLVLSPVAGVLAGLVAGAYPAWRASRIQPVVALAR